jgi:hypothetical protein
MIKRIVATAALTGGLMLAPLAQAAFAQTTAPDAAATAAPDISTTTTAQPQAFNYGWLGLLGLFGLGGLMRRSPATNTYVERK